MVEIVLKITWQSQNNMKKCATVSDEMEGHKKKLISSSDMAVSLKKNYRKQKPVFFLSFKALWEFKKRSGNGKAVYTQNINFWFKTNLLSLDNFLHGLKDINGENKKILVEPIVYSQQLSNLKNVSQDTGKWSEFKTS